MLVSAGENIHGYKIAEFKDIVFGVANSGEGAGFRQVALKKWQKMLQNWGQQQLLILKWKFILYQVQLKKQQLTEML